MIFNNKKGIVFTLLAILLSTMFVLILTGGTISNIDNKLEISRARGFMIEAYYDSFVSYSDYAIELSAKSCLISLSDYLIAEGINYTNNDTFFEDVANCMQSAETTFGDTLPSSENQTISKLLDSLIVLAQEDYGINTNYNIISVRVYPRSPDKLRIFSEISVRINDSTIQLVPYVNELTVDVSFIGISDPFYNQQSFIEKNKILNIKVIGENDMDLQDLSFEEFLNKVQYIQSSTGYSVINRFLGEEISSKDGLIYFINGSENLADDQSYVDIHATNTSMSFACDKLWCLKSDCNAGSFRLDENTFNSMVARYDLIITNWQRIC